MSLIIVVEIEGQILGIQTVIVIYLLLICLHSHDEICVTYPGIKELRGDGRKLSKPNGCCTL